MGPRRLLLLLVVPTVLLGAPAPASARYDLGVTSAAPSLSLAEVLRSEPGRTAPVRGVWPLRPRPTVVARFDPPEVRWGAGHRGVDLRGEVGQPVRAAMAGTVTFAGRIAGRGVVVVGHGTTRTTYEPVLATVSPGRRVAAGAVVGRLAGAASHCAPRACLHWGLRRAGTYLDPLTLLEAPRPVRLYPW